MNQTEVQSLLRQSQIIEFVIDSKFMLILDLFSQKIQSVGKAVKCMEGPVRQSHNPILKNVLSMTLFSMQIIQAISDFSL